MGRPKWARRRLLALATTSIASVAGCSGILESGGIIEDGDGDPGDSPNDTPDGPGDAHPDGPTNRPHEPPAATFHPEDGDSFALHDLSAYTHWATYEDMEWSYHHPNSRVVRVFARDDALAVRVESMTLNRDIDLEAHYQTRDGSIATTHTVRVSPESEDPQTYEWELPFDGTALPRRQAAVIKLIARDTHTGDDTEYVLKEHRCAVVPYQNSEGSARHYINSEALNFTFVDGRMESPRRNHSEVIETDTERTRFFALTYPSNEGRILTGYSNVPHDAHEEYMDNRYNNDWRRNHNPMTYAYNADDFEYFTSLADSFAASLDANGTTTHFDRLQKLAHLVGCIPYQRAGRTQNPQVYTLYNMVANCTAASTLYLALQNTDAFNNTRGAFILCDLKVQGEWSRHTVIGIDERDLNAPDPDAIYWVEPTQEDRNEGLPDTRYAFLELTQPRPIGAFRSAKYDLYGIIDSTNLDKHPEARDF